MKRAHSLVVVACLVAGCQLSSDRVASKVLVDDGQPKAYAEMLTRARQQAISATDAFYVNRWPELEELAQGLEQTAKFLGKAADVPAKQKDALPGLAAELGKAATALGEAAKAQDGKKTREALERVHGKIYELRLEN